MTNLLSTRTAVAALLLAAAGLAAGCSSDPQETAARYAASADAYAQRGQYKEAIIEYRNALKTAPQDAGLRYRLGRAYEESDDPVNAYGEFARAADLDPSNVDAQMRAGTLLLASREFEAARIRAELAIKADPSHAPAHILLGNALAGLNETAPALRQIEEAIRLDPEYAPAWTALGAVTFLGGRKAQAGEAFQKAVELSPRSIDARLALANYQWASNATAEAEGTLKAALELESANASAHRALALLYVTTQRAPEAEPHFRALATDAAGQLALADYYMGLGRNADARAVLDAVAQSGEKGDSRSARLRIAAIEYAAGRKVEAHRIVDELIAERSRYVEARTAKARMLLADGGSNDEALTHAREAVKADATSVAAHYTLGLAALRGRDLLEAERAFQAAVQVNPRAAAAHLQLAKLRLARGEAGAAVASAEAAARERPDDPEAAVLLAQSLRAQGNVERAARELDRRLAAAPESEPLLLERGWLSLERGDAAKARDSFTEALRVAPQSLDARHGLISIDVAEGQIDAARARVAGWRAAAPGDVRLTTLAARVELAAGAAAEAERLLTAVIERDPSQLDAYELLGRAYVTQGRTEDAIRQYEALASRAPEKATGARTMAGLLHEARGDRAAARAAYEQVLAGDPKAGVAANNLAWIHASENRLDEALRLAKIAQDSLRRRPEPEDTLGWVYLKKGFATQAIAAFERARERAPRKPVYLYHLGLAYVQTGDRTRAQEAFARALEIAPDFDGAADARAQLAALAQQANAGR